MKIEITNPTRIIQSLKQFLQQNNIPIQIKCENESKEEIYSFSSGGGVNQHEVKGPYQYFEDMMNAIIQKKTDKTEKKNSFDNIYDALFNKKPKQEGTIHPDIPLQTHMEEIKETSETETNETETNETETNETDTSETDTNETETKHIPNKNINKITTIQVLWDITNTNDEKQEPKKKTDEMDENVLKGTKLYYMVKRDGYNTQYI
jgi:cag pathogenicity island protein 7